MATVRSEIHVTASPDTAWDAVRDFAAPHRRLYPGVLTDSTLDGDTRTVTFANGLVVHERLVTVDDDARRLVYTSVRGRLTHHNGALEVFHDDGGGSRVVWTIDLLPDEMADAVRGLVALGVDAMRRALA
jgi:Polyketide cyclase / dehydrase and lipid transport